MKKAIREHLRDFIAIAALLVFGLGDDAGDLLPARARRCRAGSPAWARTASSSRAEFSTAQAVTPGQGQTVNIAGIKVGDLTEVGLEDGNAVVTMEIDNEYAPLIHEDATMLLRPRTGLQDMTVSLDPGTEGEPVAEGTTIPVSQTPAQRAARPDPRRRSTATRAPT